MLALDKFGQLYARISDITEQDRTVNQTPINRRLRQELRPLTPARTSRCLSATTNLQKLLQSKKVTTRVTPSQILAAGVDPGMRFRQIKRQ